MYVVSIFSGHRLRSMFSYSQGLCFVTMIPYLFFLLAALSISFILGLTVLWNWAIVMLY
jgi:hypothetical protein